MPRLKLSTIEQNIFGKKYINAKDVPETAYCPECPETVKKFLVNENFLSGTGIGYHCKNCDYTSSTRII